MAAELLRMLYRRRWIGLAAASLVVAAVAIVTVTTVPVYEARAQLMIEAEDPKVVSFEQVLEQNKASADYYQTQARILRSRRLARETLNQLRLWQHPEFAAASEEGAIDAFLGRLTVSPIRYSRLIDVTFASRDPQLAANVVNTLAKAYIEQSIRFEFSSAQDASSWLRQQLEEQRKHVDASERALQQYREAQDAVSLEERQNIVVQRLNDLNAAVTKAKTTRLEKESLYNQIRAVKRDDLDTVPAVLQVGLIQQLKAELAGLQRREASWSERRGDRHPDMIAVRSEIESTQDKLRRELDKVVQSVRNDYQAALSHERTLAEALEAQKTEALKLNRTAIQYSALEREAVSNQEIFKSLMLRTKETGIAGQLKATATRVVDEAEAPLRPSRPNRTRNALLGLLAGLFFGVACAFAIEIADTRIRTPEDIRHRFGLPFLGLLPSVDIRRDGIPAHFTEAVKAVRTGLSCSPTLKDSRTLLITSAGPGEGKTMVATNVAVAFAQAGQRVLVIDADMRRPRLHDLFGRPNTTGLADVIAQSVKADEAILATDTPNLSLLTSGQHMSNPAELLASPRFAALLSHAARSFDWIVLDSPPVMPVTDAVVAAHVAHHVLFVIGAEMASRGEIAAALDRLTSVETTIAGAVLNNVELRKHPYYYRRYYRREYGSYLLPA